MTDDTFRPGGLKMTGNIPPAMKQAMKEVRGETEEPEPEKKPQVFRDNPASQGIARSQLQNLLDDLKGQVYDEIKLPSKGMFYDGKDGPKNGILHVKAMTGDEELILATPKYVRKGTAVDMIFQRCIQEKFKSSELLSADRTYLLIWLRGFSFGHEYEVEVKCPMCDRKSNHTIDLSALTVDYCPVTFTDMTGVLPKSGYKFTYRFARGKDEQAVQEYRDRNLKMKLGGGADNSLHFRTALTIEDLEGLTSAEEVMMLLQKLPIQDVAHVRNLINNPPFGVNTKIEMNCEGCYHDFEVEMPLEANFFFPQHKRNQEETR